MTGTRWVVLAAALVAAAGGAVGNADPGASLGPHLFVDNSITTDPDPEPGTETSRGVWIDVEPLAAGGFRTCVRSFVHYAEGGSGDLWDEELGCADGIATFDEAAGWSLSGEIPTSGRLRDGSPSGGSVTLSLRAAGAGSTGPGCSIPWKNTARGSFVGIIETASVTGSISATLPGAMPGDNHAGCAGTGVVVRTR